MDTSSPHLLKAAENGEPLKEVVIELNRPDGKGMQRLTLEKAIIGSIQQKSQGIVPQEEVTFHYQKLTVQDF